MPADKATRPGRSVRAARVTVTSVRKIVPAVTGFEDEKPQIEDAELEKARKRSRPDAQEGALPMPSP